MTNASDVEAMLDRCIYEYMRETNRQDCAEIFAREAGFRLNPDLEEPRYFLQDWWKTFTNAYGATHGTTSPQVAQLEQNAPLNVSFEFQSPGMPITGFQTQQMPELMSGPVSGSNLDTSGTSSQNNAGVQCSNYLSGASKPNALYAPDNVNFDFQSPRIPITGFQKEIAELMSRLPNLDTSRTSSQNANVRHGNYISGSSKSNALNAQHVPFSTPIRNPQTKNNQPKTRNKTNKAEKRKK